MDHSTNRNKSFYQDLSPICTRIKNVSWDLISSLQAKKISKFKLQPITSLTPSIDHTVSSDKVNKLILIQNEKSERRLGKLPSLPAPRVSEGSIQNNVSLVSKQRKKRDSDIASHFAVAQKETKKNEKISLGKKMKHNQVVSPKAAKTKVRAFKKVMFFEACCLEDWYIIARPEIERMWNNLFYAINGIKPIKQKPNYKYYVLNSNSAELIRSAMASRTWWTETSDISEANFICVDERGKDLSTQQHQMHKNFHENDTENLCLLDIQVPVKIDEEYRVVDISDLGLSKIKDSKSFKIIKATEYNPNNEKVCYKFESDESLLNKITFFKLLKGYYEKQGASVANHLPTFYVINSVNEQSLDEVKEFMKCEDGKFKGRGKSKWIFRNIAENTVNSRKICKSFKEISNILNWNSSKSKFLLQRYINPFILNNRQISLTSVVLLTNFNGVLLAYLNDQPIIKCQIPPHYADNPSTISSDNQSPPPVPDSYLSLQEFQTCKSNLNQSVLDQIILKTKEIIKDSILSTVQNLSKHANSSSIEVFTFEFLLDSKLKPWITHINSLKPPSSSSFLSETLSKVFDNALRISLDSFFPRLNSLSKTYQALTQNNFELIFNSLVNLPK